MKRLKLLSTISICFFFNLIGMVREDGITNKAMLQVCSLFSMCCDRPNAYPKYPLFEWKSLDQLAEDSEKLGNIERTLPRTIPEALEECGADSILIDICKTRPHILLALIVIRGEGAIKLFSFLLPLIGDEIAQRNAILATTTSGMNVLHLAADNRDALGLFSFLLPLIGDEVAQRDAILTVDDLGRNILHLAAGNRELVAFLGSFLIIGEPIIIMD